MTSSAYHNGEVLSTELHLHLYGCLSAADLWRIGKDRFQSLEPNLRWFSSEYQKQFGVEPQYQNWWKSSQGFEDFCQTFLIKNPLSFAQFQAKFNLLIALNPAKTGEYELAKTVFSHHSKASGYKEYRTYVRHDFSPSVRHDYLLGLLEYAREYNSPTYKPRFALSVFRDPAVTLEMYEWLIHFCNQNPWTKHYITGIDFCGDEQNNPPNAQQTFFNKFWQDRILGIHKLDILYHVGEMWDDITLASAARWVAQASEFGIKRLGHALALGANPSVIDGKRQEESVEEFHAHCNWIRSHLPELTDYGYSEGELSGYIKMAKMDLPRGRVVWDSSQELKEHLLVFQTALCQYVKKRNCVIEVCLTSNFYIGGFTSWSEHPIHTFLKNNLDLVVATDDPGIFDIDLKFEETLLQKELGVSMDLLKKFEHQAKILANFH